MTGRDGFTLGELATALGATLEGDPRRVVTGVAPLETAGPDENEAMDAIAALVADCFGEGQ